MNEFCKDLISKGVPRWIVEKAYKFTLKTLKGAEGLVGAEREYAELYRNAIVSAYIEGASVALEKAQRYYGGEEHS
jgi:hypothetical protein